MSNGILALLGGVMQGMGQARIQRENEEYKKAMIDQIKTKAKLDQQMLEFKLRHEQRGQETDDFLMKMLGGGAIPGRQSGGQGMTAPQFPLPVQPQSGNYGNVQKQFGGGVVPQPMNQPGQPFNFTGTTGRSATNNNPLNLEYRPGSYQDQYGATIEPVSQSGQQRFAKFPNMMAGYQAGLDQIKIDQQRGHTLASFVSKFAPPHENPTGELITSYAQQLGVSPDIPLAQIPAEKLIIPMMMRESSTKIVPVQGQSKGGPQSGPPQGGRGQIDWNNPIFRAFFKRKFDIDPKANIEVKGDKAGGFIVFENGVPVGRHQGPMGVETYEAQDPNQGTPYRVYQRQPGADGALQPPIAYVPTGPTAQRKAELEGQGKKTQEEIVGLPPETAGKVNLVNNAIKRQQEANKIIFKPDGSINREVILKGALPGAGIGEARTLYSKMYQAIDGALRLETGAQATPEEIKVKMNEFWPSPMDSDNTIRSKMRDFGQYLNGLPDIMKGSDKSQQSQGNKKLSDPLGIR